jgi:alpha-tubulin suppressor-like RCC1 family protein
VTEPENPKSQLSRRAIVGTAAWAAPAIVLSAASPAAAASTEPPLPPNPVPAVEIQRKDLWNGLGTGAGFYAAYAVSLPGGDNFSLQGLTITATYDVPTSTPGGATGDPVTVTLPAGLRFADGSTVKNFTPNRASWPDSVSLDYSQIEVPWGTPKGNYTIVVTYKGKTDSVTITVLEGGMVYAWGNNARNQVTNSASAYVATPNLWGAGLSVTPPAFSDYTTLSSSTQMLCAYTTSFTTIARAGYASGASNGVRRLRDGLADSVAATIKGAAVDGTYYWKGGTLYATAVNSGDHLSLGDGTAFNGAGSLKTEVAIGTKILEANPGKTIKAIHAGTDKFRAAYILSDGTVWNSGANTSYAMGIGPNSTAQYLAAQTQTSAGVALEKVAAVAIGATTSLFLDTDGLLWGAGTPDNTEAPLPGLTRGSANPYAVSVGLPDGKAVKKIWAEGHTYFAQAVDDSVYFTGANPSSRSSIGSPARAASSWRQVTVAAGKTVAELAVTPNGCLWLMTDATLYFSGNNTFGGFGDGSRDSNIATSMRRVPLENYGKGTIKDVTATYGDSYAVIMR